MGAQAPQRPLLPTRAQPPAATPYLPTPPQACPIFGQLLLRALELIEGCDCGAAETGCPGCIQHTHCGEYNTGWGGDQAGSAPADGGNACEGGAGWQSVSAEISWQNVGALTLPDPTASLPPLRAVLHKQAGALVLRAILEAEGLLEPQQAGQAAQQGSGGPAQQVQQAGAAADGAQLGVEGG